MRYRKTIEYRRKGRWEVELLEDGTIYATSFYRSGHGLEHKIPKNASLTGELPRYVQRMIKSMREAHPEVSA